MTNCPVCGRPSAPNAAASDPRCGPCHNFGVVGFDKYGSLLTKVDFNTWHKDTVQEIDQADNMATYQHWLNALKSAYEKVWT